MAETISSADYSAPNAESLRTPPYSLEAEQAVLGGLMLENGTWDQIVDTLNENDFHLFDHRIIFRAIADLAYQNHPFDVVTLADKIKHSEDASGVNSKNITAYMATLAKETPTAANISAYADIVREKSILRQLATTGTDIAGTAYQPQGMHSRDLLDIAEKKIFEIGDHGSKGMGGFKGMKELLKTTVERIDELFERGDAITGTATGFDQFDENTSGLQKGDLIIVAGRPSMGKTSLAMNMAEYAVIQKQETVAIFSMEMPSHQLTMRMLSSIGRINQQNIRTGKLSDEDWPRLTSAVSMLSESKLFIDDSPALSPTEIRARARRLKREHGLSLIVIDYLQLMQVTGSNENRTNDVSEISRSLKALAKELEVPVIALSQLNRSLEQRTDKRPVMSDLRESGAIEQDADLIVFIYRDEVYNEETPDKGTAEIIVAKQRNGPIFKTRLTFLGQYTRFENFIPEMYSNEKYS
ncbi:MAG: replicative DNA helicase [Gammaproteobacteria bacterium]|nr:replicative DNA helicase [Gammaproteobacteria bacterium]